jgi:transposase
MSLLDNEKNVVVKERLLAVSMFLDGVPKGNIKRLIHKGQAYVGTWITAYFNGGVAALADNRGGDHKSLLTQEQMQLLKQMITTSHPVYAKVWDGHSVVDLIEYRECSIFCVSLI